MPSLIPEGLTILGGRPKVGKSRLLMQMSIAIGCGGTFLGIPVNKGKVLYLAFEDSERRLQERLKKMQATTDADVVFEKTWTPFHLGGTQKLIEEIEKQQYTLVIIDTLTRAFPGVSQKDRPEIVAKEIDTLQYYSINNGLAIIFNDHTRKSITENEDAVDDILGSTEKVKSADCVLALYKNKGKTGAVLKGRGRDVEETEINLSTDFELGCWKTGDGPHESTRGFSSENNKNSRKS